MASMNAAVLPSPEKIRPLVHERIDQLTDEELASVHRQLELLEMKRNFDKLCEEFGEDWRTGRITQEKVDEAIREYRATHPYRTPGRP
jgi:hypothetical protein